MKIIKEISGVFDGQCMISSEGKFPVNENYASKSKLVEGDELVLRYSEDGRVFFKQALPVERKFFIGKAIKKLDSRGRERVEVAVKSIGGMRSYKILSASVSYFHIEDGDEVTIIIPKDDVDAHWAAVEGIISQREPYGGYKEETQETGERDTTGNTRLFAKKKSVQLEEFINGLV
jgi:hypothetical protein